MLIERGHYPARFAVRRLDDVQRPDRKRFRVVRGEVHFFDVYELGRPVVGRVQCTFDQPSVVCGHRVYINRLFSRFRDNKKIYGRGFRRREHDH